MKHHLGSLPFFFLIAGSTGSAHLTAQETRPVAVGDRVRVTPLEQRRIAGELISLGRMSLGIRAADGSNRTIGLDRIRQIERSVGRKNYVGRGALIGGGIGFGLGAGPGSPWQTGSARPPTAAGTICR